MASGRRAARRRLALVLVVPLLAAGCGGDGADGGGGGEQSSPEAVVAAAYTHIAAGELERACALVLPDVRGAFAAAGTGCQTFLAGRYDRQERKAFRDVRVDPARVERDGDTALVPERAVTFGGRPSDDDDTPTVRQDGRWWVTTGT